MQTSAKYDFPISKVMITDVVTLNENYSIGRLGTFPQTLPVLNNEGKVVEYAYESKSD